MAKDIRKVQIVYYSGTGNSRKVAECFDSAIKSKGTLSEVYSVAEKNRHELLGEDLLILIYAVHGMNAPEAIYTWISSLPAINGGRAAVISVSGGGEVMPNTASRVSCIKRLEKKGYTVFYETMLVMPSNWIVATKEPLAVKLLEVLPQKVGTAVEEIISGTVRRTKPALIDRVLSRICELEKLGAREFGKKIKCGESCDGCGLCSSNCPAGNISIIDGKPSFGKQCHMCLNCIYGCPTKALSPGIIKFVAIKEGYSLKELEKKVPYGEYVDVQKLAKGFIWSGVRKYLENEGSGKL